MRLAAKQRLCAAQVKIGYHGTLTSRVPSILRNGIKGDGICCYLADTEANALMWARAMHGKSAKVSVVKVAYTKATSPVIQIPGDIPATDIRGVVHY